MSSVTREQIIGLLKVATCPASCDNGVVIRDLLHGEIEQCQFCFERLRAIAALQAATPVAEVIHNFVGVDIAWCDPPSSGRPPVGTKLFTLPCPPAKAQVPDEAFNIIEGIRAELTWPGWRSARSRDRVMDMVSELLSMLPATPAPERSGDSNELPDWEPIETAPMDGTHIQLYRPNIQFIGYYGGANSGWRHNAPGLISVWPLPTHWMPLHDPPRQEETER